MIIKTWVPSFEGIYQISSEGKIYSWKSGNPEEIRPSRNDPKRHMTVELSDGNSRKKYYIHRLVWESFNLEKLTRKDWIHHKDKNLLNNSLSNLERKTNKKPKEPKLGKYAVLAEDGTRKEYSSLTDISKEYGLSPGEVKRAIRTGEWQTVIQKKNL